VIQEVRTGKSTNRVFCLYETNGRPGKEFSQKNPKIHIAPLEGEKRLFAWNNAPRNGEALGNQHSVDRPAEKNKEEKTSRLGPRRRRRTPRNGPKGRTIRSFVGGQGNLSAAKASDIVTLQTTEGWENGDLSQRTRVVEELPLPKKIREPSR